MTSMAAHLPRVNDAVAQVLLFLTHLPHEHPEETAKQDYGALWGCTDPDRPPNLTNCSLGLTLSDFFKL